MVVLPILANGSATVPLGHPEWGRAKAQRLTELEFW
jgi:hypothetical protein